ncbi:unnamed protein product, partial [Linum tenue]
TTRESDLILLLQSFSPAADLEAFCCCSIYHRHR